MHDCFLLYSEDQNEFIKTIFKPLEKYNNIVVNHFPKTFKKSKSFRNALDDNITKYILSPFNEITIKKVKKLIDSGDKIEENDIYNIFNNDTHFTKCVKYVLSIQNSISEEKIEETYYEMISDIINYITISSREFVLGQNKDFVSC